MNLVKEAWSNVLYGSSIIAAIIGASIIWHEGPSAVISLGKAQSLQIKENPNIPYNTKDILKNDSKKFSYVVRLHTTDGRFFCSGFVISDIYLITAAHCLVGVTGKMRNEDLIVRSSTWTYDSKGTPIAVENNSDLALVTGDFSQFNKVRVLTNANELTISDSKYETCGYPMGVYELTCYKVQMTGNQFFSLKAKGFLFKGMSGGPVIDVDKDTVIALNTAVDSDGLILSPLIGLFSIFGVPVQ